MPTGGYQPLHRWLDSGKPCFNLHTGEEHVHTNQDSGRRPYLFFKSGMPNFVCIGTSANFIYAEAGERTKRIARDPEDHFGLNR
jgi:hypothetical protein